MYRYFFRFVVMTITILTANLLTTAINSYMVTYRNHVKPVMFTFIGMAIIVVVFYPLFVKLEEWVKGVSVKLVRSGKSLAGKYLGLVLTFCACLMVLCYYYAKLWYNIDLMKILLAGKIEGYI